MNRSTKVSPPKSTKKTDPVSKAKSASKKSVLKTAATDEDTLDSSNVSVSRRKTAAKKDPVEEIEELEKPAKKAGTKKVSKKSLETAEEQTSEDIVEEKTPAKKPRKNAKKKAEEIEEMDDETIDIEEKVFSLIKKNGGGIYQNEIWKKTNIDSRKCSRILKKLLDAELIIREEAVVNGTKTYLLKTAAEEKKRNYSMLMVKSDFSPCTGCFGECRPEYCPALTFWVMNISENPESLRAAMGYNPTESESHEIEVHPEFIGEMRTEEEMPNFDEETEYE